MQLKKEKTLKCIGKREFDKSPKLYISELDNKIEELNQYIEKKIKSSHAQNIKYNESPFDNIDELSYGHDGLIKLAAILIKNHKKLRKIISDKYSFIFIDEYQDTSPS
ncbi:UvrD-helicase domain-containing protein [Pseudomonas citronellolis]|uniref:UvrD-helicase domain-containing protein n=1 Tax=Pseudomonas citronellolis TaxID=53408 RepID=UPI0036F2DB18